VVFDPWKQESWDQNDNLGDLNCEWRKARELPGASAEDQRALTLALAHAGTLTVAHQDTLARTFLTQADNGSAGKYDTRVALDIEGNPLSVTDARGNTTLAQTYNPQGQAIRTISAEAGTSYVLYNIEGTPIRSRNSRTVVVRRTFDAVRRPTHVYVSVGGGTEFLAERTVYGEGATSDKTHNLRGQVYRQYDGAGVVTNVDRDFKGNLTQSQRQLAKDYTPTFNWNAIASASTISAIETAATASLESEVFTTTTAYDALNRVTSLRTPDTSEYLPTYNEASLLEKVDVKIRGAATATATPFVADIDYNAKGQRTSIAYAASAFTTTYVYNDNTFRLKSQATIRGVSTNLQNFALTYDAVGNIVQLKDSADPSLYFSGTTPVTGGGKYEYDAIYRLVKAEGREHPGQTMPDQTDGLLSTVPHPNNTQAMRGYEMRNK
jgi:YD repeat-containing protein